MNKDRPVIVAMDLGEHGSRGALAEGHAVARRKGCRLILVHVLRSNSLCVLRPRDNAEHGFENAERRIEVIDGLRRLADELPRGPGVEVEVEIREGNVADEIIDLVEHARARLLVVGGRTYEVGRTAAAVLRRAPCPVLVARASDADGPVAAATDLSDPSMPVLTTAAAAARAQGVELHAIHVVQPWVDPRITHTRTGVKVPYRVSEQIEVLAEHLERRLERLRARAIVHTPVGLPATTIARIARETNCRLLVVAAGRSRGWSFFAGSLARDIVRRAPCSVLVTRPPAPTSAAEGRPLESAAGR